MSMISWLDQAAPEHLLGGKGANLCELLRSGFPVPNGFVVTTEAYHHYLQANGLLDRLGTLVAQGDDVAVRALFDAPLPADLAAELTAAWHNLGAAPVAVRSSATAEDLPGASFAGQQDSFLHVHGEAEVCDAVRRCFASLWTERAIGYRSRQGIDQAGVAIAAVVQLMVPAEASGVLFTVNPTNGRRDEMLLSATFGLGESLVQGGDADALVIRDGEVVGRSTAQKMTMTIPGTGQGTVETPVAADRRRDEVLDDARALEIAALGERVAAHLGGPQDIEWVLTGGVVVLVQARPVTALGALAGAVPEDWSVPDEKAMYARASIIEQMPDPLSPLFASMVRPAVVRALEGVLSTYFGADALHPGEIDFPTINGYAYYYYSREGMLRLLRQSPAAVAALAGRSEYNGEQLWNQAHPAYRAVVEQWGGRELATMPSRALLQGVQELLEAGCAYYSSVQALIPLAASAEIPFVRLYQTGTRSRQDPPATVFLLGFDSRPLQAERSLWELAQWARGYDELRAALLAGRDGGGVDGVGVEGGEEFTRRLDEHLARFGHTVYNLDFMVPVPADDPRPVLETLRWYLSGKGEDPSVRVERQAAEREKATKDLFERLDPARRAILKPLLAKAQHLGPLREDALADVGLAWPVMRRILHLLGTRLVDVGVLEDPDEVFWLTHDELAGLCDELDAFTGPQPSRREAVAERQMAWRGQRQATPPQLLPHNAWYRMFHRFMPSMEQDQAGPVIKGLGASQGRITAPARVVRGPEDFSAMMPGEVLVSPITTPAYTPLFAMAAAVVTDVGGPLSHSSIVAREYAIPAVLGTGIATRRIRTGMLVTVDGDRGTVTLPQGEEPLAGGFRPKVPYKFVLAAAGAAAAFVARRLT